MASDKTLLGLDIGTSWTRCVIGSISRDGELMVEAINEHPSSGVKNGSIVNIEQTVKVINQAAFYETTALKDITIPKNVQTMVE